MKFQFQTFILKAKEFRLIYKSQNQTIKLLQILSIYDRLEFLIQF